MGLEVAVTGAVLAGAGGYQAYEARQARKDTARARVVDRQIQNVKEARERRRQIREARIRRAEIESSAVSSGAQDSSSAISGAGNVGTQLAANLSFLDTVSGLEDQASIFRDKAAKHSGRAQDAAAIGSVAGQAATIFTLGGKK